MLLYLFATAYFIIGVFVGLRLTQLSKDIKYIRMSLEELENAVDNSTWVVYDNDEYMH
tara:strand:+ start:329 stop:502 length:174 start_codon:yes stop_codon:yes gene_type:complete